MTTSRAWCGRRRRSFSSESRSSCRPQSASLRTRSADSIADRQSAIIASRPALARIAAGAFDLAMRVFRQLSHRAEHRTAHHRSNVRSRSCGPKGVADDARSRRAGGRLASGRNGYQLRQSPSRSSTVQPSATAQLAMRADGRVQLAVATLGDVARCGAAGWPRRPPGQSLFVLMVRARARPPSARSRLPGLAWSCSPAWPLQLAAFQPRHCPGP